jgi:hypothetical protein
MSMKDLLHRLQLKVLFEATSCANAAAFNSAFTTTNVDTQGFETNMLVLHATTSASVSNYVFTLYETDVSATDAGAAVTPTANTLAVRDDNSNTKISAGVLTMTAAADNGHTYIFEYLGNKRWFRLNAATGSVTVSFDVTLIQSNLRHGPYYTTVVA